MLGLTATTIVHPAGHDVASLWEAASLGRTALRPNPLDWCELPCWLGAVPGVDEAVLPPEWQAWDCRNHRLAWLALRDEGFRRAVAAAVARHGAGRVGLVLGTSTSGIRSTELAYAARRETGAWPASFDYRRVHSVDALCRFTAQVLGLQGPMATMSTACSSSAKVFLTAQRWIELGLVDCAVVGGVDSLCLSTLHGFDGLQLLSDEVCRPFDAARKGISIGEAGGFALLERTPAEVLFAGGGESSDAWHMSTPHPEGEGAQAAMRAALDAARLAPGDIGYLNAHGTATQANDKSESAGIRAVFGAHRVPVSSTKGVTGHTLGAAGIVEAIVTAQALAHQSLPPAANWREADAQLDVDVVTAPAAAKFAHAMSNNFGFGGSNCALVFSLAR
ncbi:beta-ketoacyl-ACP synthase [Caenimonas aquaedulcis]|uniref:Beta-ketoacyl-ACP synthase n=1 Tax=Caenimonas aquaedulcis TaxID=2793270 RepID=A0A931H4H9_9BURK|nr:beta-ketoacyl-ACP synthase [Caenimonas aquaedulcis]